LIQSLGQRGGSKVSKVGIGTRLLLSVALSVGAASALSLQAGAADTLGKAPTQQPAADSGGPASAMWVGGDFKQNVAAGYGGGVFALNGNLDKPGWLLRGDLVGVGFDFAMPPAPNGRGDFFRGDGAIGYQVIGYGLVAQGFVGADYENYDFHPASAGNPQLKDRVGAIFFGRVASATATQFPFAIDGLFETANNDFWVRGRTGVKFGKWTVGPEAIMLGSVAFDEARFGGFATYDLASNMSVQANLGYADGIRNDNSGRGSSGVYGGVTLVFVH
jgi:hypothetical protein